MVKTSESAKHAYTYIPPSVQKSMTQHMERNMPGHLQKYRQGQGHIPEHIQGSMAEHMNKNMPAHLKKYVDPYLDQHVVNPHLSGSRDLPASPSPVRPVGQASRVRGLSSNAQDDNLFAPDQTAAATEPVKSTMPDQSANPSNDPYGFIMNPQKTPRRSFSFSFGGGDNKLQKVAIIGGGLIGLFILFSLASNFLNGANKAQQAKLISLANAQSEIIRMADTASENIKDKNLLYMASTVKITVESSRQDVTSALTSRGKKFKDEQISIQNPDNDAALNQGTQNGRYDEAYSKLLTQQLEDYKQKLQDVYSSGNSSEQELAANASDQLKLLSSTQD